MGSVRQLTKLMNQIILIFAFFGSAVLSEEVVRNPKMFFDSETMTLQTASISYCPYCRSQKEKENHVFRWEAIRKSSSASQERS